LGYELIDDLVEGAGGGALGALGATGLTGAFAQVSVVLPQESFALVFRQLNCWRVFGGYLDHSFELPFGKLSAWPEHFGTLYVLSLWRKRRAPQEWTPLVWVTRIPFS
jgi:hypothetical protein